MSAPNTDRIEDDYVSVLMFALVMAVDSLIMPLWLSVLMATVIAAAGYAVMVTAAAG